MCMHARLPRHMCTHNRLILRPSFQTRNPSHTTHGISLQHAPFMLHAPFFPQSTGGDGKGVGHGCGQRVEAVWALLRILQQRIGQYAGLFLLWTGHALRLFVLWIHTPSVYPICIKCAFVCESRKEEALVACKSNHQNARRCPWHLRVLNQNHANSTHIHMHVLCCMGKPALHHTHPRGCPVSVFALHHLTLMLEQTAFYFLEGRHER